jgi:chemotaxis protein CheY-P-specific phosphatase CheC
MDQQKRFNKILDAAEARIQDEVGTLLGADFSIISGSKELVTKAEAFSRLLGKQICAHVEITGEIIGKGCLLIGIKDAIRLGGTLIMLPDSELQEVIGREEYREEIEDSYGEIANIITGSITKVLEEMYPKACRLIRKEQQTLAPAKVDIESDSPVANETFYLMSSSMLLEGRQLGDLVVLFPAKPFALEAEVAAPSQPEAAPVEKEEPVIAAPISPSVGKPIDVSVGGSTAAAPEVQASLKPKFDREKHKKKVDRILAECEKRLSGEISALLGVDVMLDELDAKLVSKEEFFSETVVGKQVLTNMEVVGDLQDAGYFTVGLKDAIHLGGVLIMLPPSELISVVNEEEFNDDARDAFGEVANIVSGVYTAVFEEQYPQKLRFIRKSFDQIAPNKVVVDSPEPIPNQDYYCQSMHLLVAGKQLGAVHMLFPAQLLQLNTVPEEDAPPVAAQTPASPAEPAVVVPPGTGSGESATATISPPPRKPDGVISLSKINVDKHKKLVDKILISCRDKMVDEVSALLGTEVQLNNLENKVVAKENFFLEEVSGKQVIAHMDVVGELEGKSYLAVNLRDAIRVGGVLIMLPAQELESVVSSEVFGEDTKDAYGEIANIIAGVYTSVFEEQYTKNIRFVKTDLQQVSPMKVVADSDDPFPNGYFYLSSSELSLGENVLGKVQILFPLNLLELSGLLETEEAQVEEVGQQPVGQEGSGLQERSSNPDILLIGDDDVESAKISAILGGMDFIVKTLSFKDNVHNYIPGELKAIYLVMKDVNEQAFGAAIKISSSCTLPLIAAGPGWTRTKVIKAVKYGVRDILLTPASKDDIAENVANNLLKKAA